MSDSRKINVIRYMINTIGNAFDSEIILTQDQGTQFSETPITNDDINTTLSWLKNLNISLSDSIKIMSFGVLENYHFDKHLNRFIVKTLPNALAILNFLATCQFDQVNQSNYV